MSDGMWSFARNLITEPHVRLKYQQHITNSFVDVRVRIRYSFIAGLTWREDVHWISDVK